MIGRAGGMRGGPGGGGPREQLALFQSALRDHLHITDDQLQKALLASVDDQLAAQKITKDQADAMKKRINAQDDLLTRDLDKAPAGDAAAHDET
jgi:hypothetical protein